MYLETPETLIINIKNPIWRFNVCFKGRSLLLAMEIFFQYPNPTQPEVEKPYPSDPDSRPRKRRMNPVSKFYDAQVHGLGT